MGCNCKSSGSIPLSLKKEMRQKVKEKIADVKKIWAESAIQTSSGTVMTTGKELGFK